MILKIFCVFDRQSETYSNPMFLVAPGQASRSFADEINRAAPDNPLFNHPDDFDLYYLGTFDPSSGSFTHPVRPESVILGKNVKINGSPSSS